MFHQGDIESGIDLALSEGKLVACLVLRKNDPESQRWEEQWFAQSNDDAGLSFGQLLAPVAVILKLYDTDKEAEFLTAFCPIRNVPKLVVISDGLVVLNIERGVTDDDLKKVTDRLQKLITADFGGREGDKEAPVADQASEETPRTHRPQPGRVAKPVERRHWTDYESVRLREAKAQREKILLQVRDDRLRMKMATHGSQADKMPSAAAGSSNTNTNSSGMTGETCSLQVRLFDGASVRSRFDASATLTTAVRAFVSEHSNDETPYNFRLMDLPRPSRTIEISEEGHTLKELGLCPGATLVLVPVKDFTDAYASSGFTGVFRKGFNLGYNVASGVLGVVGSAVGRVTGFSRGADDTAGPYIAGTGEDTDQGAPRSKDPKKTPEFYNGNQLGIVPRSEDEGS